MSSIATNFLGTGAGTGASPTTIQTVQGLPTSMPSVTSSAATAAGNAVSSVVSSVFFNSRFVAIVLGLICIAGAIILYVGEDVADALGVGSKSAIVKKGVEAVTG